jgi:hypothetical protein
MLILRVISIKYIQTERGLGGPAKSNLFRGLAMTRSGWIGSAVIFVLPANIFVRYIGADESDAASVGLSLIAFVSM